MAGKPFNLPCDCQKYWTPIGPFQVNYNKTHSIKDQAYSPGEFFIKKWHDGLVGESNL